MSVIGTMEATQAIKGSVRTCQDRVKQVIKTRIEEKEKLQAERDLEVKDPQAYLRSKLDK